MTTVEIIAAALIKYGPAVARALYDLFSVANPTKEDWDKVFKLAEKSYEDYVKPIEITTPTPVSPVPPA